MTAEMTELEAAHLAIIGKIPTYMRPPYLATNALVLSTLESLEYKIIEVDIDTQDWAEDPLGDVQLSIDWYEGNLTAGGSLSLNHDPYEATANTFVPAIIKYLATKNLVCKLSPLPLTTPRTKANNHLSRSRRTVLGR
jgi:peptidoglycan/xylan/chitin deacetylase (PgdA/CDA1 family)